VVTAGGGAVVSIRPGRRPANACEHFAGLRLESPGTRGRVPGPVRRPGSYVGDGNGPITGREVALRRFGAKLRSRTRAR